MGGTKFGDKRGEIEEGDGGEMTAHKGFEVLERYFQRMKALICFDGSPLPSTSLRIPRPTTALDAFSLSARLFLTFGPPLSIPSRSCPRYHSRHNFSLDTKEVICDRLYLIDASWLCGKLYGRRRRRRCFSNTRDAKRG